MIRNKENNPLYSSQSNGLHARNLPSEDFFTDSLLDDSRHSNISLIPSPAKPKTGPVKPRRALPTTKALQAAKDSGNKSTRTSLLDYTNARTNKELRPSPKFTRRKSPSPEHTNGLTTPPQSRHGPPLRSPSEFSSPPGGLHESYQRIADDEDLAATERDVDSDEDEVDHEGQDSFEIVDEVNDQPDETGSKGLPQGGRASEHSTPVQLPLDLDNRTGSFSAPPTLDFVQNEMSERVLAAKLTPHVVDRARDRERLQRLRQGIPIDFKNVINGKRLNGAPKNNIADVLQRGPITFDNFRPVDTNGQHKAHSDSSADVTNNHRFTAFGQAGRRRKQEVIPDEDDDDGSDTPDELREVERTLNLSKANKRRHPDGTEAGLQSYNQARPVAFSQAYSQRQPFGTAVKPYEEPLDDHTISSVHSEPISAAEAPKRVQDTTRAFLAKWRRDAAQRKAQRTQDSLDNVRSQDEVVVQSADLQPSRVIEESEVDWAAAGADYPMPSVEKSETPRDTPPPKALPIPISKQRSIDRIRRFENNDFTGMSFQVSESPPVRGRNSLNDSFREEIEDLSRQAVTSNRLDEIRVKDPNVVVRKTSRNFGSEERTSGPVVAQRKSQSPPVVETGNLRTDNPDTPIAVYRSSSQNTEKSKSSEGSMPDSLDQLKRLARAVSTTPRASPALKDMVKEVEEASAISLPPSEEDHLQTQPKGRLQARQSQKIAETPRVVGAWTDTILPDTVRIQRQAHNVAKYAQTPHVSAGGWIDTPLPNSDRAPAISIPNIVEEETEAVGMSHDVPETVDEASEALEQEDQPDPAQTDNGVQSLVSQPSSDQQIALPTSALSNVLNEAKQKRLVSRDITDGQPNAPDDTETLNLGDTTIQSMEDLLTDAADITADLTSLIKTDAQDEVLALRQRQQSQAVSSGVVEGDLSTSDVAFIGSLTSRMERLMSNLHEARKGISRLEQRVSHAPTIPTGPGQQTQVAIVGQNATQSCSICSSGSNAITTHTHIQPATSTSFFSLPVPYTTFTLPIPLLFHPRTTTTITTSSNSKSIHIFQRILPGRPTWLGYLTICLWTWYLLECVLTEIYARPLYTDLYVFPPPGAPSEPEFPFVLPTMLCRWTLGHGVGGALSAALVGMIGGLRGLFVAIYRIFCMLAGWSDGFVDDRRATGFAGTGVKMAKAAAKTFLARDGDGYSMNDDEIL